MNRLFLCKLLSLKSSKIAMIEIDDVGSKYVDTRQEMRLDPARVL
jgi:hypothetical protein